MRFWVIGFALFALTRSAAADLPTLSGSATVSGYSLRNEPLQHDILQNDTGFLFQLDLSSQWMYRDVFSFDAKMAIEGPSRYGLLLSDHRTTLFGTYKAANLTDIRPYIDSARLTLVSPRKHLELEAGIVRHASDDKYANPGLNIRGVSGPFRVNLHFSDVSKREGICHQPAGLSDTLDVPDGINAQFYHVNMAISHHSSGASSFFKSVEVSVMANLLIDRTPAAMRWNALQDSWGSIIRDDLGTTGISCKFQSHFTSLFLNYSRNFGHAETETGDSTGRAYRGTCLNAALTFNYGIFELTASHLDSSGHPFEAKALVDQRVRSDFLGFVNYPPTDLALYDSHYIRHDLPLVFTGGTLTPYYGLPRPGYQRDAYSIENLIATKLDLTTHLLKTLSLSLRFWHVRADTVPPMYQNSQWLWPSKDLGDEFDLECTYRFFDHCQFRFFYGIVNTGQYYRDVRDYFAPGPDFSEEPSSYLSGRIVQLAEMGLTVWL